VDTPDKGGASSSGAEHKHFGSFLGPCIHLFLVLLINKDRSVDGSFEAGVAMVWNDWLLQFVQLCEG
jgi:hypothetical protein